MSMGEQTDENHSIEISVMIANRHGLHARPSLRLASLINGSGHEVALRLADGEEIDGRSAMSLMGLRAEFGSEVLIRVTGSHPSRVVDQIKSFLLVDGPMWDIAEAVSAFSKAGERTPIELATAALAADNEFWADQIFFRRRKSAIRHIEPLLRQALVLCDRQDVDYAQLASHCVDVLRPPSTQRTPWYLKPFRWFSS